MTEITTKNFDIPVETELPEEKIDFVQGEISHSDPVLPKIDIKGAEVLGNLGEVHTDHIQAIGGVNTDSDSAKVLPEHISETVLVGKGDTDKSSSWLAEVRNRMAKLKGAA